MLIEVTETANRGRAIVATKKLVPGISGLEVITEKALVIFPTFGGCEDSDDEPVPDFLGPNPQLFSDWCRFLEQPEDVKKRVLSLYTDLDCRKYESLM
jgi:hypothetical protein